MLCAECPRCRRRSILGKPSAELTHEPAPEPAAAPATGARLRCDFCGSKDVRIITFASPIEAVRFANQRM